MYCIVIRNIKRLIIYTPRVTKNPSSSRVSSQLFGSAWFCKYKSKFVQNMLYLIVYEFGWAYFIYFKIVPLLQVSQTLNDCSSEIKLMWLTNLPFHGIYSVVPHSVVWLTKPSPCRLHWPWFKSDGSSVKLHQLGVEGLDILCLSVGDAEALQIQQSPGQVINFLPARDASRIYCFGVIVLNCLILKYMYVDQQIIVIRNVKHCHMYVYITSSSSLSGSTGGAIVIRFSS